MLQAVFANPASFIESVVGLTVITVGALWLAGRAVGRREYVLEH
jgi:hypothetical protein